MNQLARRSVVSMVSALAVCGLLGAFTLPARAQTAPVAALLQQSAADWNAGKLDAFMTSYERSPQTTSISGDTVFHGYDAIRAHYVKHYGSKVSGKLSFSGLAVRPLGPNYALAMARFHLVMADGTHPTGLFSLVLHRSASGWHIILDH